MTRNNRSPLSHHEQLRYRYLLSNIRFLNEKEQQEFDYLRLKSEAESHASYSVDEEVYSYSSSLFDESYAYADAYAYAYDLEEKTLEPQFTAQGLPIFEEEPPLPKRSTRNKKAKAPLPPVEDYQTSFEDQSAEPVSMPQAQFVKPMKAKKVKKQPKKGRIKRFLQALAILLLLVFSGMVYMFFKGMNDVSSGKTNYTPAVIETFNGVDSPDGTNILLLGSDQRITQGSSDARTDTIMVMNIGNSDNKVKLVSFMRDTLVNIPGVSYSDYTYDQKLNVAFNLGEQDNNQGAELMRETLKNNFDIDIKYYVMLDFETFGVAIDTLFPNGVKIDAKFNTVNGEEVTSVEAPNDIGFGDQSTPYQTINVGEQRMNGQTLLNYARFRSDDAGDFGRTERQQQVIAAIISQIKDPTKLFTGSAAIGKIYALTSTNVPFSYMLTNGISTMSDASKGIEHITIPAEGDWVDDYDMYGGMGLWIDFEKYQGQLADLGMR